VARRIGPPNTRELTALELRGAEAQYLDRCASYYDALHKQLRGAES
jgi:hypothetical protein